MYSLLLISGLAAVSAVKYLDVSSSTCEDKIDVDSTGDVYLSYTGAALGSSEECTIEFKTSDSVNEMCVEAKNLSIGCHTTVEYHGGILTDWAPDRTLTCSDRQYSDWCSSFSEIWVRFKGGADQGETDVQLRIYSKESWTSDLMSNVKSSMIVIIAAVSSLIAIVVIIAVICCCKRMSSQGTVYRSAQQSMPVTAVQCGYQPPPQQMGYQYPPQQTGYQPPPQGYAAGYQPPPQGYQQTSYPPPPQQGYTGYQNAPNTKSVEASAPPMGLDFPMQNVEPPPPYPGN